MGSFNIFVIIPYILILSNPSSAYIVSHADECRLSAIKSRTRHESVSYANCFIEGSSTLHKEHKIHEQVPLDWQWTLDHEGAISGQVFSIRKQSIEMISLVHCMDRGNGTGNRAEQVHTPDSSQFIPFKYLLDFEKKYDDDPYLNCVKSRKDIKDFRELSEESKEFGKKFNFETNRSVVKKTKRDYNSTTYVENFTFKYNRTTIDELYEHNLKKINRGKSVNAQFESNKPIIVKGYPFETGISFFHTHQNYKLLEDYTSFEALPVLAWNLALKAKSEKSGSHETETRYEERVVYADIISSITQLLFALLAFLGLLWGFEKEYDECFSKLVANVSKRTSSTTPIPIRCWKDIQGDVVNQTKMYVEALIIFLELLAAFLLPVLYLNQSRIKFREFVRVSQGGVIVYGKGNRNISLEADNPFVAAEFCVAHWYVATIDTQGKEYLSSAAILVVFVFAMFSLYKLGKYSLHREHDFGSSIFRAIRIPSRRFIALKDRLIREDSYVRIFNRTKKLMYQRFRRNDRAIDRMESKKCKHCHRMLLDYYKCDDKSTYGSTNRVLSRNEIEKAAEILTADKLGLLKLPQVLSIMSIECVKMAANNFRRFNILPGEHEVKLLAFIYYVQDVVVGNPEMLRNVRWSVHSLENIVSNRTDLNEERNVPIYAEKHKQIKWIMNEEALTKFGFSDFKVLVEVVDDEIHNKCDHDELE